MSESPRYEPPERKETSRDGVEEWFREPAVAMGLTFFALFLVAVFIWRTWSESPLLAGVLALGAGGGVYWLWYGGEQ